MSYYEKQDQYLKELIVQDKQYSIADVLEQTNLFCMQEGLARVTTDFCLTRIRKYGGKLGKRGGNNNPLGGKTRPKRKLLEEFELCPYPEQISKR